jgi:transglutaminase-like putative cysteine protease
MKGARSLTSRFTFAVAALALGGAVLLAAPLAQAEPTPERLEVDLPYQAERSDPVTHEVDFSVVVTPPEHCQMLKIWLPLPPSDVAQEVFQSSFSAFPDHVDLKIAQEPVYGNRFAYFEFQQPRGAQMIRHRFKAKVWELRWEVNPQQVAAVEQWPSAFEPYLKPHPVAEEEAFRATLQQFTQNGGAASLGLFEAMNWIDHNLTYDHAAASLQADAQHAFTQRRGHCSDYHSLCATMGRALGYPTRVTYGLSLFPKNSPSHCKMEAFLPPYGWVSFDLSETQKLLTTIASHTTLSEEEKAELIETARRRLKQGFRENSWLLVTRGTDYELAPKASQPVRVVRTIYAEADGVPLPEPDPANPQQREFAWMTVHKYTADKEFSLPFQDLATLTPEKR